MLAVSAFTLTALTRLKNQESAMDKGNAAYISVAVAAFVTAINLAISVAIGYLTDFERSPTRTDHEESGYFKLASAYVVNSVLLVLFVEDDPRTWADVGGVYSQVVFIAVGAVTPELFKVLPLGVWVNRLVMPLFTSSQQKLNALYEPPAFPIGNYYAAFTKTLAIALVFGPAVPVIFPITLGTLCISYWANKFRILRIAKPPPDMDVGLSEEFCTILSLVLLASAFVIFAVLDVSRDGEQYFESGSESMEPFLYLVLIVWSICWVTPTDLFPCLRCATRACRTGRVGCGSVSHTSVHHCCARRDVRASRRKYENTGGDVENEIPYSDVVGISRWAQTSHRALTSASVLNRATPGRPLLPAWAQLRGSGLAAAAVNQGRAGELRHAQAGPPAQRVPGQGGGAQEEDCAAHVMSSTLHARLIHSTDRSSYCLC